MLFTDSLFLFYFLPATLVLMALFQSFGNGAPGFKNRSKALLFVMTLAFYGSQQVWWVIPFAFCVVFDFVWASLLSRIVSPVGRKAVLFCSVFQNLGLLGLFKYWAFLRSQMVLFFPTADAYLPQLLMNAEALALPAGISFYTFESLSFVIDVYRREVTAPKNPLDFAAFIAMFPRFVAGPIVRYREISGQFRSYSGMQLEKGLFLFLCGFSLKTLFADQFAVFTRYAFESDGQVGFVSSWVGVLAYTFQIYFDFSGYSLMAIGLGHCLGFSFPDNFNRPYLATSLQDFWRRWHMTLSRWLRDYVYVSLGGSRKGVVATYRNLIITMVLGGIWHGAGWTFFIWGLWHGLGLALERRFFPAARYGRVRTFLLVVVGWVFFRAKDLSEALSVLSAMANPFRGAMSFNVVGIEAHLLSAILCLVGVFYCFYVEPRIEYKIDELETPRSVLSRISIGGVFVFAMIISFSSLTIPFLYFQF